MALLGWLIAGLVVLAGGLGGYVWIQERQARKASVSNLNRIGLAMHAHNDKYKRLPTAAICDKSGKPGLSWRVALLPFLGEEDLYRQFKLDEPWDSPHNKKLLDKMPKVYAPAWGDAPPHTTHYQVFTGPKTPFVGSVAPRIPASFPAGVSNTILLVEADDPVPWTKPADLVVMPKQLLPRLGGLWGNGFFVVMGDGYVRFVERGQVNEETLRQVIDPRRGEEFMQGLDWKDS
jgi:hypothetical protein